MMKVVPLLSPFNTPWVMEQMFSSHTVHERADGSISDEEPTTSIL